MQALKRDLLVEEIEALSAQIARVQKELKRYSKGNLAVWQLRSISGVGLRTAEAFVAFLDDPHRFANSKRVGSYFGLVPTQDQSGRTNRLGHITREGSASVRHLLIGGSPRTTTETVSRDGHPIANGSHSSRRERSPEDRHRGDGSLSGPRDVGDADPWHVVEGARNRDGGHMTAACLPGAPQAGSQARSAGACRAFPRTNPPLTKVLNETSVCRSVEIETGIQVASRTEHGAL